MPFLSGSAWAMARDVAHGHVLVTDRTLRALTEAEMGQFTFEVSRYVRELRAERPDAADGLALREHNRKLSRLTRVERMVQAVRRDRR